MITPSALAQTTYYKIGDYVSFAWNYTSLSITPSKVDVLVSCSANSATYTLQSNASFEKTGSVVWDTSPDITGTAPLLTETYTLVIYDAQEAITEVASAGKLGVSDDFTFGMYIPQKYTPLSGESFSKHTSTRLSTYSCLGRLDLRGMQRCAFRHRATGSEVHVGHVHRNRTVLYLVRQRHFLGRPTLKPYKRPHTDPHTDPHTGDNDSAFTQACISEHFGRDLHTAGRWTHRVLAFSIRKMLNPSYEEIRYARKEKVDH